MKLSVPRKVSGRNRIFSLVRPQRDHDADTWHLRVKVFSFSHSKPFFLNKLYSTCIIILSLGISSVQSLSRVRLFVTPWTASRQASLSITNSWSLLKLLSIELVIPSNHLILCCPLLLSPSIFPNIMVFSNQSVLHIRWPKYWSISFSTSNEYKQLF